MNTENLIILIVLCGASLVWISMLYKAWHVRDITITPIEKSNSTIDIRSAGYEIFRVLKNIFLWTFPFYLWWFIGYGSWLHEHEVATAVVVWIILLLYSIERVFKEVENHNEEVKKGGTSSSFWWTLTLLISCVSFWGIFIWFLVFWIAHADEL